MRQDILRDPGFTLMMDDWEGYSSSICWGKTPVIPSWTMKFDPGVRGCRGEGCRNLHFIMELAWERTSGVAGSESGTRRERAGAS